MSSVSDHWLEYILYWFNELENELSGISGLVFEVVVGKIPDSKINEVYALAEAWQVAATRLADIQGEVGTLAEPLLEGWRGDASAAQFVEQWSSYHRAFHDGVTSLAGMGDAVRQYGLQIELLKFMVAFNLLLLAAQLIALIITAFFTGGLSLGAAVPLVRATGSVIASLAGRAITAISSISLRVVWRNLPKLLPRALPTAGRLGAPGLTRTALPSLVRNQLPVLVRTQLPHLVRAQVPHLLRAQLPHLTRTILSGTGRGAMNMARNAPSRLARNFLPKNVIARFVANRAANQLMRSMAHRHLLRALGRQAGARMLTHASLVSARNALAWQIEQQLLRKFSTEVASGFVERGAARALSQMSQNAAARQVTSQTLGQEAMRITAQVTFGRELAKYMATRIAYGTVFMAGGNLVGQLYQLRQGNRASMDWGQLGMYTGQGLAFGAALWGGAISQGVGGGLAAGTFAAGVETWDYFTSDDPERRAFDWGEVAIQAGHGAAGGFAFGLLDQVQLSRMSVPARIGGDVAAMPHPRADRPVLLARDANASVMLDRESGALVQRGGGATMWLDQAGKVVAVTDGNPAAGAHFTGDAGPDGGAQPATPAIEELPAAESPPADRAPVVPAGGPTGPTSQGSPPIPPRLLEAGQDPVRSDNAPGPDQVQQSPGPRSVEVERMTGPAPGRDADAVPSPPPRGDAGQSAVSRLERSTLAGAEHVATTLPERSPAGREGPPVEPRGQHPERPELIATRGPEGAQDGLAQERAVEASRSPGGEPAQPSEPSQPHSDGTGATGDRPSTIDEYWSDPPWRREERQPSLDELIPASIEEAHQQADAIRQELARLVEGREFAGLQARVDPAHSAVYKDVVDVRYRVTDEHGEVGHAFRSFRRDDDGKLFVTDVSLQVPDSRQGREFARAWKRDQDAWYQYSGVDSIEVHASLSSEVGGFARAQEGYDWARGSERQAKAIFARLQTEMVRLENELGRVEAWLATGDRSVTIEIDSLQRRHQVDDPAELAPELRRQHREAAQVLERAERHPFRSPPYPAPYEVAEAGWRGQRGEDAIWIGKRALLESDWWGAKPVSDAGVQFPRPTLVESNAAQPAEPARAPAQAADVDRPPPQPGGAAGGPPDQPRRPNQSAPGDPAGDPVARLSGHGGPLAPSANYEAARSAARYLAANHPDPHGNGYTLRWADDPTHGELLRIEGANRRQPSVAIKLSSGEVPEGRLADTRPISMDTDDGLPIYQTTVSHQIPELGRELVARHAIAYEIAKLREELRPRRLTDLWRTLVSVDPPGRTLSPHEHGLLSELRLELSDRLPPGAPLRHVQDQRIGALLDRFGGDRLDDLTAYLESAGQHSYVADVRALAAPDASWRTAASMMRRSDAVAAVAHTMIRLSSEDVGLFSHGELVRTPPRGLTVEIGVPVPHGPDQIIQVSVGELVDALGRSSSVGERIRAQTVAALAARVADQEGDRLGGIWGDGGDLAAARTLVKLAKTLPPDLRAEYTLALRDRLDRLTADQLGVFRSDPLPISVEHNARIRQIGALMTEALATLTGESPSRLAAAADRRADGGLALTGHDGRVRQVPKAISDRVEGWLNGRLFHGADVPTVRAELTAGLAAELRPYAGSKGRSVMVPVLSALGEQWADPQRVPAARAAVEAVAGEILARHELRPVDVAALPPEARRLVDTAPPVPRSANQDPYLPLRADKTSELTGEVDRLVQALAGESVAQRAQRVTAAIEQVGRLRDTLDNANTFLYRDAHAKLDLAQKRDQEAAEALVEAARQRDQSDAWAGHRAEDAVRKAENDRVVADRHLARAAAYERAAGLAEAAALQYSRLAEGLTALTGPNAQWRLRLPQVLDQAVVAKQAYQTYHSAMEQLRPAAMDNAVPMGRLPRLEALATQVNTMLAGHGIEHRMQPGELQRELLSKWRWVAGEDGAVISVAHGAAEIHVKLRHGYPVEVIHPPETGAELAQAQLPQFPQGTRIHGAGMHRTYGLDMGPNIAAGLTRVGDALPDLDLPGANHVLPIVRETLRYAVLRASARLGPRWSVGGEGAEFSLTGAVFAVKEDLPQFDMGGAWETQLRLTGEATWSPPRLLEIGGGDRSRLQLLVPHSYTEPPPTAPAKIDHPLTDRFPEHAVTMAGTYRLRDAVLRLVEAAGGQVTEQLWQAVQAYVHQEFPARLDQAINNPGGWHRDLRVDGRPVAVLRIKTSVVRETAQMVGTPSNQAPLEKLRVAFAQATGSTSVSHARGAGVEVGARVPGGPGEPDALAATYPRSRGSAESKGFSVARVGIRPNVQRFTGHTQGYELQLVHDIAVEWFGGSRVRDTEHGVGVFRLTEPEAYRYGLPVDPAAVRRDADGHPLRDEFGRELLRDDPLPGPPPGREGRFPEWLGPSGIPGAGPANVSHLTGVDRLREQLEARLRQEGWLPPIDDEGFPTLSADPIERIGQLNNLRAVAELHPSRLEADYSQAAQQGILLTLERHAPPVAPRYLSLRVQLTQGQPEFIGHTHAEAVVNLDIGRQVVTRTGGETKERSYGGAVRIGGAGTNVAGANVGRPTYVSSGWSDGEAVHQGTLVESAGRTAVFRVPHEIVVRTVEKDESGLGRLMAGGGGGDVGRGEARVVLPVDLLPEHGSPRVSPPPSVSPVPAKILPDLMLVHVDGRRIPDVLDQVLPAGAKPNAPSYGHLAAFTNVNNMVANPTWLSTDHRTDHAVDPRGFAPLRSGLSVRGALQQLEFVSAARLVGSHINFTMGAHGVTAGRGGAISVGADAGSARGGLGGERAWATGRSYTAELIKGRELLDPVADVHYVFRGRADLTVTGTEHHPAVVSRNRPRVVAQTKVRTEPLPGTEMVGIMRERDALKHYADGDLSLPLRQVEDALTRHRGGHLDLSDAELRGIKRRYAADLARARVASDPPHATEAAAGQGLTPQPIPTAPAQPTSQAPIPRPDSDAVQWRLPESLRHSLGQGGAEPVHLVDADGHPLAPVALLDAVLRQIDRVTPGALASVPGLHAGLAGQLAGRAWDGKLERMLGPGGWQFELPVPVWRYGVQQVRIALTARFLETDTGAEGALVGRAREVGSIHQDYGYQQETTGRQRSTSNTGSVTVGQVPANVDHPDGQGVVGRVRTGESAVSTQLTAIQRLSSFGGVDRFQRPIEITVQVSRQFYHPLRDLPNAAWQMLLRRPTESAEVITGAVVQRVPTGLLRPAGDPDPPVSTTPVTTLPERYVVESVDLGGVPKAVKELLARKDLLGRHGVARHDVTISRVLSRMEAASGFAWMHTPGGHGMLELPRPGHPDQVVRVVVEAQVTGQRVGEDSRPSIEIGHDSRSQDLVRQRDGHDRLFPATRNVRDENAAGSVGYSKGESADERTASDQGDRDELKAWMRGKGITVEADVQFHVSVEVVAVSADGAQQVLQVARAPEPIAGLAYLTQFESEVDRPATGPGAGEWRVDQPDTAAKRQRSWLPVRLSRSRHHPVVHLSSVLRDLARDPNFAAATAPELVAQRLASDLGRRFRSSQVLHLDSEGAAKFGADPLAVAAAVAERRGGEILVELYGADGVRWPYRVLPDGAVHPAFPDGGYAAARAALPTDLVDRAAEAGLSLQSLHRVSMDSGRAFVDVVAEAVTTAQPAGSPHPGPTQGAVSGTKVLMADGTAKNISEIRPGEEVWAADPRTGHAGPRAVTAVSTHGEMVVDLVLDDGVTIRTTLDREFWNQTDQEWQRAEELDSGDQLVASDGRTVTIRGIDHRTARSETTHHIAVADDHTFFVLADDTPVLVHNHVPAPRELEHFPAAKRVKPKTPVQGGRGMRARWEDGTYIYEWDSRHGEVEKYNRRGRHLGSFDPETGEKLKDAIPGRKCKL